MRGSIILLALIILVTYSFSLPIDLTSRSKRDANNDSAVVWRTRLFFFLYGVLIFLSVAGCILWRYYKKQKIVNRTPLPETPAPENEEQERITMIHREPAETANVDLSKPINERMDTLTFDEKFEIDKEKNLRVFTDADHYLGGGEFGAVHKGRLRKANGRFENDPLEWMDVAVKRCTKTYDTEHLKMLEYELKAMCAIGKHPNVLTLVGATRNSKGHRLIILEFVDGGCLRDFLKNRREEFDKNYPVDADKVLLPMNVSGKQKKPVLNDSPDSVSPFDLLSFSYQIANGMEYLAKVPMIHRDLALRNVLIRTNKTIRIGDFGLARRHMDNKNYYRPSGENIPYLPIFHVAPECLQNPNEKFSEKSDVWSYGVCLYEIFSLGEKMYEGQNYTTLGPWLQEGNRLEIPKNCPHDVADLMKLCWNLDPEVRPLFEMCRQHLETHLKTSANQLLKEINKKLRSEAVYQKKMEEWL